MKKDKAPSDCCKLQSLLNNWGASCVTLACEPFYLAPRSCLTYTGVWWILLHQHRLFTRTNAPAAKALRLCKLSSRAESTQEVTVDEVVHACVSTPGSCSVPWWLNTEAEFSLSLCARVRVHVRVWSYLVSPKPNFDLINLKMCSSDFSCSVFCKHRQLIINKKQHMWKEIRFWHY